ncbi:MAG: glutamyl-tRNA reductase [Burkholderiales bacterium]|jgi:glutamyl-tRNA reductase|nr:glutamyl-tRNA reductase [Burkholderiales bacterium]
MPLLYTLGLNHTTAPLDVREKVAFAPESLSHALRELITGGHAKEAAILSTCNRTEIYCRGGSPETVAVWLEDTHHLSKSTLTPHLYTLKKDAAVSHAFRVACGLDSMVLGEPQILGQMKQAARAAKAAGTLGVVLDRLFQHTFSVAKDVRTHTDIGSASISMAAAAVKLAERIFPSIADQHLLLIGAGEMIELAAAHFQARSPKSVTVANRTLERGQALAERFGGNAITLNEIADSLERFDMIVTCTASPLPILGKGIVERALKARRHRPVFMVDFAVPRDIEKEVGSLNDVFLYSLDDLSDIVRNNLAVRREAITQAEAMVSSQTEHFLKWFDGRSMVPTINALRNHYETLQQKELEKAQRQLANGQDAQQVLESLARGLTNKLLHAPLNALHTAEDEERTDLTVLYQKIYHLPDNPPPKPSDGDHS